MLICMLQYVYADETNAQCKVFDVKERGVLINKGKTKYMKKKRSQFKKCNKRHILAANEG